MRPFGIRQLAFGMVAAGLIVPPDRPPLGFTRSSGEAVRTAERKFADGVSAARQSVMHYQLTREPHPAGTAAGRRVASWLARTLSAEGLDVETAEYSAYLSRPKRLRAAAITSDGRIPLRLEEPASGFDRATAHPALDPAFVAYAASGRVSAPVVQVGYGLPGDYVELAKQGIDVKGRIALAKYGRSHRAVKVHAAQEAGAVGIILYSDPGDDGAAKGRVWPEGPWRPPTLSQRGNAKFSWFWHGDPLTPGVAARPGAITIDPGRAPTLPRIPAIVLSAREALPFLGTAQVAAEIDIEMEARHYPIRNVVARLPGASEPDREVMIGTHHDAWTFGGVDPGTSASVVLEVARGLAALARAGWRPRRTIAFAFWDAEEYGLIGSTEYAEDRAARLRERVVCYMNSDYYMGDRFDAGGVPSLRDFVVEVARDLALTPPAELAALGSGADFVAFQDFLGLPTLSFELDLDGSYGVYHSSHDTRLYFERMADPGSLRGPLLARILGTAAVRLASADVLPFRYSRYARRIGAFIDEAATPAGPAAPSLRGLADRARRAAARAETLEERIDRRLAEQGWTPAACRRLNDALARLEQAFIDESKPPDRRWYRHVIYGWNIHSLYDGQPLPGLTEAIRLNEDATLAQELARLAAALARFESGLTAVERALDL